MVQNCDKNNLILCIKTGACHGWSGCNGICPTFLYTVRESGPESRHVHIRCICRNPYRFYYFIIRRFRFRLIFGPMQKNSYMLVPRVINIRHLDTPIGVYRREVYQTSFLLFHHLKGESQPTLRYLKQRILIKQEHFKMCFFLSDFAAQSHCQF